MTKKIFILLIIILVGLVVGAGIKAGPQDNVYGWAWAGAPQAVPPEKLGLGWISFNCLNDYDGDGTKEDHCTGVNPETGLGYVNYGVNIEPSTGFFEGFAWSENIGWIWFAPTDTPPGETGPKPAKLDLITKEVSGWARAVRPMNPEGQTLGGWDGWILLGPIVKGGTDYGSYIDTSVSPAEFWGWAWGSDVVGWISFNRSNTGAAIDYKVMTDFFGVVNQPPYIESNSAIISGQHYCNISPTVGRISFEWRYKDADEDSQSHYHLQVATDSGFNNKVVDREISQSVSPDKKGTSAVLIVPDPATYSRCISGGDYEGRCVAYGNSYYWRVRVKAAAGNQDWSSWETGSPSSFTTPVHAYPWPDFSHSPQNPSIEEIVTFIQDDSTPAQSLCYDGGEHLCQNDLNVEYAWDFSYEPADGFIVDSTYKGNATTTYSTVGTYEVRMRITDNTLAGPDNYCIGAGDSPVGAAPPLPEYKEVPPIIWLKKVLAAVIDLFNGMFQ